eukprot:sb/3475214/
MLVLSLRTKLLFPWAGRDRYSLPKSTPPDFLMDSGLKGAWFVSELVLVGCSMDVGLKGAGLVPELVPAGSFSHTELAIMINVANTDAPASLPRLKLMACPSCLHCLKVGFCLTSTTTDSSKFSATPVAV